MHLTAIVFFVIFTAVCLVITSVVVKKKPATELNAIMRFLLRWPAGFWGSQLALTLAVCLSIFFLPPWFSFLAVSVRAMNAFNDFMVWKGKIK